MIKKIKSNELLDKYRDMYLIRVVENQLSKLFSDSEVPGFIHLSVGQEAIAVGVMSALDARDSMATTHRGHGHVLARGLDLEQFFMEVMGRAGGICQGRGGSMHVSDMHLGIIGANGIVGAGIPIATGSAIAHLTKKSGGVAVSFFGDGAMAEGVLHESLNMAALWQLPIVYVCENNGWSEFSQTKDQIAADLKDIAAAFHIDYQKVDGNNIVDVLVAAKEVVGAARQGRPQILECITHRVRGHYEGDAQKYREDEEMSSGQEIDPLKRAEEMLASLGVKEEQMQTVRKETDTRVMHAIEQSRLSPQPDFTSAFNDVYAKAVKEFQHA